MRYAKAGEEARGLINEGDAKDTEQINGGSDDRTKNQLFKYFRNLINRRPEYSVLALGGVQ